MKKQITLLSLFFFLFLAIFTACSSDDSDSDNNKIKSIEITSDDLDMSIDQTMTLTVAHNPATLPAPAYEWKTSDATVVSVADGVIKALKLGQAIITAEAKGLNLKSQIKVTVKNISPESLELSTDKNTISVGEKTVITSKILPANTTGINSYEVEWASANSSIASVNNGEVTGVSIGNTDVTATIKGTSIKATYNIIVKDVSVQSVTLTSVADGLKVGKTLKLTYNVLPENASNKNVIWSSSNIAVATIDMLGTVTAVAVGTSTITVKTQDGEKVATIELSVLPIPVEGITLSTTLATISSGETHQLIAMISPADASNKGVTYSSSNTGVATVDAGGKIRGIAAGTATIVVKTVDGGHTASFTVTVKNIPVTGIVINQNTTAIRMGTTLQLTATVSPSNAQNKNFTWSSTNTAAATISASGLVTPVGVGTTDIRAITNDGNKIAILTLEVKPILITSITLNKTDLVLVTGTTFQLKANISPSNAVNDIMWESYNAAVEVDQDGNVTGISDYSGNVRVVAKSRSNPNVTATCNILTGGIAKFINFEQTKSTVTLAGTTSGLNSEHTIYNNTNVDITLVKIENIDQNNTVKSTRTLSNTVPANGSYIISSSITNITSSVTAYVTFEYNGVEYVKSTSNKNLGR
jgi:uncharacterized protein YjdB